MATNRDLTDLNVFIVGLGSMGKRRVRNLLTIGLKSVYGFDLQASRRNEAVEKFGIKTYAEFSEGLAQHPDAIIISTPPDWHVHYALKAVAAGVPFFMEASVVLDGMQELAERCREANILGAPSCTMRFYPGPRAIREIITSGAIGQAFGFTYHVGMYLPDWHPTEDHRTYYVAQRNTGGAREIVPFELVWLTPLFGRVTSVMGLKRNSGSLGIDIDDQYHVLLDFNGGCLGHLMVDVLDRDPVRFLRVVGSQGSLEWRMYDNEIKLFKAQTKKWEVLPTATGTVEKMYVNPEEPYIEEMKVFLAALLKKERYPYSIEEDISILQLMQASEESSDQGVLIKIPTHQRVVKAKATVRE
jgi:predicted dehydrogenase